MHIIIFTGHRRSRFPPDPYIKEYVQPPVYFLHFIIECLSDSSMWGRRKKIGNVVNKILLYVDDFLFIKDSVLAILPQMEGKVRTNPVFSLSFPRQSMK